MAEQRTVVPGDHLTKIADECGLPDTDAILSQPANAWLRERKHPEMLSPGEVLSLPGLRPLTYTLATGQKHRLTLPRPKAKLQVKFVTLDGQPTSATQAKLALEGGTPTDVSLSDGELQAPIPVTCPESQVELPPAAGKPQVTWRLKLGFLPRMDSDDGPWARLRNLGFYRTVPKAADARERRSAVEEFQFTQGLTVSGKLDEATLAKIEEVYGC